MLGVPLGSAKQIFLDDLQVVIEMPLESSQDSAETFVGFDLA